MNFKQNIEKFCVFFFRIKSDERFQRALEKEKIRRDYEALTAKLDAISKDENVQKKYNGDVSKIKFQ